MKINKIGLLFAVIIIFLLGLFLGLIINSRQSINTPFHLNIFAKSCEYNGNTYKSGEGFEDIDGCNSCSCENGEVVCTLMACEASIVPGDDPIVPNNSGLSCYYNGKTYKSGEGFQDKDGCNSCSCDDGKVACTLMACEENE